MFNWLRGDVGGARCLDLFAGSGVLGLEALSRGAVFLCAVEQNRAAAQRLRENVALLHEQAAAEVQQRDALRMLLKSPDRPFDVAFVDPPFADRLLPRVSRLLEDHHWLTVGAQIYLEQDVNSPWPELPANWAVSREGSAGQSAYRLVRRSNPG